MKAYNVTANADLNTAVVGVYVAAGQGGWYKLGAAARHTKHLCNP